MIYLYDFQATKEMMDRVGEPAELKPVKAKAARPHPRRLVRMLERVRHLRPGRGGPAPATRAASVSPFPRHQESSHA